MELDDAADLLLTTTRAVRRRLDLTRTVPLDLVRECLRLACQAPSGGSSEPWRWLVVMDKEVRTSVAKAYRAAAYDAFTAASASASSPQSRRAYNDAHYLAGVLHRVPVLVVACTTRVARTGTPHELAGMYGSIIPAVWSLQLALRSRGLGSVYTTAHLRAGDHVADILSIPHGVTQVALLPVAWTVGTDFHPARRRPVSEVAYLDAWGKPLPSGDVTAGAPHG